MASRANISHKRAGLSGNLNLCSLASPTAGQKVVIDWWAAIGLFLSTCSDSRQGVEPLKLSATVIIIHISEALRHIH
ncbi:hypothetical protein L228DRAFT_246861 [Xylona heveae TC161]|uniref:Uncharacterized protein n=1 Tax=Xylona heveae (strain CBS 132557 / TC161) TaxID=1328760 RepID=A0A165GSH6_XYLHT|nr:hypothetical protein L228DRAFT_246861 [Xylona heveae TC161]KZF22539.1 hypothetical protein L228DRAFT_246861 [Xylona heveae TC161]